MVIDKGIEEMKPKLKTLLDSDFRDFKTKYNDLEIRGVYAVYENDEIIYIGQSTNLRQGLYKDLLHGSHWFRECLYGYKEIDTFEDAVNFLITKCRFKVVGEIHKNRLEKFAIAIINPRFNRERLRMKKYLNKY
ncbi:GIY-YIG nuclease family protein [Candidatus Woesearchaeota archaeon]|nr:GIY-YIG nuclease family protein [Candidatus Woesearchaeota archaeon]